MANSASSVVSSKKSSSKRPVEPSSPVTRSQTKNTQTFNFSESSTACMQNKNKLGNGTYSYKSMPLNAGITTRSGKVLSA